MGLYQTNKLLLSKGNYYRKRLPSEWENISANDMSGKKLVSKIHKELIQLNIKTQAI